MSGYQRQSAADIVPTAVVRAAPINNEYNALRDAFLLAGGHRHDGSSTEGAHVPLIADADALNKVAVDTTNNRVGVFVEVGAAAVEQVRVQDGAIVPVTTNDIDLGTSSLKFKSAFLSGTAAVDILTAATSASIPSLTVGTSAVIASADINAGTVDGTVIGGSSAQAITGTTITATTGFVGGLTGAVTGNTAGTHTGPVIGAVTGDVTGNITASTGTSSFNDVTINGGLNMNAGTAATITNLTAPTNANDAATKSYVDTSISNLIDTAPGTLDTLNELAAALGDDPNFATTVTNSIATKLALAGGTMSGAIAMGTNKITGLGNPTANQDAATKTYVDTADALKLSLSGGTMSGAIAMGTNKITGLGTPTVDDDATTKLYVDGILGSATAAATSAAAAATSASNAATSASNAATSASNASTSAGNAATSASAAAASYDAFDDRYLGSKTSAPTLDNDGNALLTGALYFNTTTNIMMVYSGTVWQAVGSSVNGTSQRYRYIATAGQTTFTGIDSNSNTLVYDVGYLDVFLNGVRLDQTDYTATSGTSIVLAVAAALNDELNIVGYGIFELADHYNKTDADSRFVNVTGDTMTGPLIARITARVNVQASTTSPFAWNSDSYDQQEFTALANALTISADAGTPTDGQKTIFRFQDNGTARALTWTTGTSKSFRAIGVTLPTTTVISKTMYIGCIYNTADARWDVIAVAQET